MRLLFLLCALLVSIATFANTQILISSVPQPKERMMAPHGYASCRMVPAGFHHGIWRDQHRVCQYSGERVRGTWVSGYWTCSKFKHHHCAFWAWEPSRWEGRQVNLYASSTPPAPTYTPTTPPSGGYVSTTPPPPSGGYVSTTPPPPQSYPQSGPHHY